MNFEREQREEAAERRSVEFQQYKKEVEEYRAKHRMIRQLIVVTTLLTGASICSLTLLTIWSNTRAEEPPTLQARQQLPEKYVKQEKEFPVRDLEEGRSAWMFDGSIYVNSNREPFISLSGNCSSKYHSAIRNVFLYKKDGQYHAVISPDKHPVWEMHETLDMTSYTPVTIHFVEIPQPTMEQMVNEGLSPEDIGSF